MQKIVRAKESDLPSLMKCLRRTRVYLVENGLTMWEDGYPSEELFRQDIIDGACYVAKEGARVIGSISISHDLEGSFFGQSRSQKKAAAILDSIAYHGEMLTVLFRLFVDPAYHHQGIGKALVRAIESKYDHSTFLLAAYYKNEGAKAFYTKLGYQDLGRDWGFEFGDYSDENLFVKTEEKDGLCRNIHW